VPPENADPRASTPADRERGRALYAARAWAQAYDTLARADRVEALDVDDLERLAWAAGLSGHDDDNRDYLERVYQACLGTGEAERAARAAFWIGFRRAALGETASASGWFERARRLVECQSGECVVAGYLLLPEIRRLVAARDYEQAALAAARAADIGKRCGDVDLTIFARNAQGRILVTLGRLDEAFPLLDEAMLSASRGELSPGITGLVYCSAIAACNSVYAVERSREWTNALTRWCEQQPELVPFSGACLVHRAEIMRLGGAWPEAFDEARRAGEGLAAKFDAGVGGEASYQQGEIHRLRGKLALAEEAFRVASSLGREPQPGLALLRLAQNRSDAALSSIRRLVASADPLARTPFLPALVEICLRSDDLDGARAASDELVAIAARYNTDALVALAAGCRGEVLVAERDTDAAITQLRDAFRVWQRVGAPYEAARVRVALARACLLAGDADGASLELDAARTVFERLGAAPDIAALDSLARPSPTPPGRDHPLTARELEVLRWVAKGKTNKAIARELHLSEKTVDRHVSNILAKLDVPSRSAATAYAYERDLV
jgi:DNA-binding CsgD family transcriptional regulator